MSNLNDPFNLLTVANSVGTVGLAYWTIPTIKKLAALIEDLNEEVKLIKEENARRHNDAAVSLAALQRIGGDLKMIKEQLDDFEPELISLKVETLEEEASANNPDFEPFEFRRKKYSKSSRSSKSSKSTKSGKSKKKSKEEVESSELSESSDEELVMKGKKKGRSK